MSLERMKFLAGLTESYNRSLDEAPVRDATNRILEMIDDGILDPNTVVMACLKYMSEDEVADMAHTNEFFMDDEDDDDWEEEDDMDPDYFDDLDAGDTEMDRRSDLRRGW